MLVSAERFYFSPGRAFGSCRTLKSGVFVVASCGTGSVGPWGLASIWSCVVCWHCDHVVRETRFSQVYLHLAVLFLPPDAGRSCRCCSPQNFHRLQISVSTSGWPSTAESCDHRVPDQLCVESLFTAGCFSSLICRDLLWKTKIHFYATSVQIFNTVNLPSAYNKIYASSFSLLLRMFSGLQACYHTSI